MRENFQDIELLLQEGKNLQIKPQGYSMYPILVPGRDEVVIEPPGARKLKRGDVVLYRRNPEVTEGILVLHRIWKVTGDGFYMVGDNQKEVEGPLLAVQIKGRMAGMYRNGKYISCDNLVYRFLSGVWLQLRPFRPAISKSIATIKSSVRNLKNKK